MGSPGDRPLITALSEGTGYGESGGEGFFSLAAK
jgi:hypothetical protein